MFAALLRDVAVSEFRYANRNAECPRDRAANSVYSLPPWGLRHSHIVVEEGSDV